MATLQDVLNLTATERRNLNSETIHGWSVSDVHALRNHTKEYIECGRGLKKSATSILTKAGLLAPKEKVAKRGPKGGLQPVEVARKYVESLGSDAELAGFLATLGDVTLANLHPALSLVNKAKQERAAKQAQIEALKQKIAQMEQELK